MADLALSLLHVAVKQFYTLYKKHKNLKTEFEEVGNFLLDVSANSPVLNSKSAKLNPVKKTLRRKLESARKQVEEWSSSNSDFFRSDERLRKIQGVRQKVKDAMDQAQNQLLVYIFENQEDVQKRISPQPPENPAVPDKRTKTSRPRSKSVPRKVPPSSVPIAAIPSKPRRDKKVSYSCQWTVTNKRGTCGETESPPRRQECNF